MAAGTGETSSVARVLRTHFLVVDQCQITYEGWGAMGNDPVGFGAVHFERTYMPYGPIAYSDQGRGFITVQARRDPGAEHFPESRKVLNPAIERTP